MANKKPVMLIIMDGFGCSDIQKDNAVAQANLKVLPKLWEEYPHSFLGASGEDVGLPDGRSATPKSATSISVPAASYTKL